MNSKHKAVASVKGTPVTVLDYRKRETSATDCGETGLAGAAGDVA